MQPQLGISKKFIRILLGVDRCSLRLGISKRFISSLSEVDRCSLGWGFERGLLEVYLGWTDAASAGDLEEVY